MFLSDVSIKRPVFATILNLVLIVFGIFTYTKLGIELVPNVDFPYVTVSVVYPGADPATVEQKVLKPLEKALNGLEGLDRFSGSASPNLGLMVMAFKIGVNGQKAAQDVRDKLGTVVLPPEARAPLVFKLDMNSQPVLTLSLSKSGGEADLTSIAKDRVKPLLEQVPGVGSVDIIGLREREFHIKVDRGRLQSFGLSPAQIVQAIQSQNMDVPSGKIENSEQLIRIRTEGTVNTLEQIKKIVIPSRGQKLRVEDVSTVVDTLADEETFATYNGNQTLVLQIRKQTGGNTVALANEAKLRIADLSKSLPEGISLAIASDTSTFIKSSLDSVKLDLMLGAMLAIIIVLFFLHDWRATIISAMAIPTAVIGTVAFIYAFGFTLNVITSLALTLSIGILVDDAIVVIENIYRRIQLGDPPKVAARKGTSEIGLAALAITLSIVAVFGPVAFMEGIIGQFFFSFGISVTVAVLLSLFVAFTLTPMMGSRLLKEGAHDHVPLLFRPVARALKATDEFYRKALGVALRHRGLVVLTGIGVLIVTVLLARTLPMAFFPKEDQGEFSIRYTMVEGTSLTAAKKHFQEVDGWIRTYPGVTTSILTVGSGQEKKPNLGVFQVKLVDKEQRTFTQFEAQNRMREAIRAKFLRPGEIIEISEGGMGGGGGKPITLVLMGNDLGKLREVANGLVDFLNKQDGVVDASTSEPPQVNEYRVVIDPIRSADLGLSTAQVGTAVRSLFEGQKVGELEDKGLQYDIVLKLNDTDTQTASSLAGLSIPNAMGAPVALSSVATIVKAPGPSKIERFSGMRSITVSANFTGKDLARVSAALEQEAKRRVTADMTFSTEGQGRMMAESMASFATTLLLAIVLVYMVLAAQFESYLTPFVIMLSVSLAFVGAILGLLITGREFSMYPMIGILLLVGIVTKNAILLIDFTLQRMREGMGVNEALLEAGPIRLRPILMTTFAMIFGMVPIAIGHGAGGEARAPMAHAVIGGLITSTLLTLIVIPAVFSIFVGIKRRFRGREL